MSATIMRRELRAADVDGIGRLLRAAGNFNAAEVAVGVEVAEAGLRAGQTDYRFVVAEEEGAVAGYACWGQASLSDGAWDMYWIAVDPARRGKGLGRALLAHVEADVRAAGGRCVIAETSSRPGYEKTLAFYRAAGYRELGRLPDFYSQGDDKVIFGRYFDR